MRYMILHSQKEKETTCNKKTRMGAIMTSILDIEVIFMGRRIFCAIQNTETHTKKKAPVAVIQEPYGYSTADIENIIRLIDSFEMFVQKGNLA